MCEKVKGATQKLIIIEYEGEALLDKLFAMTNYMAHTFREMKGLKQILTNLDFPPVIWQNHTLYLDFKVCEKLIEQIKES